VISFFILLRRLVALASGWWRIITREYRDWDGGDGGVMVATRVHIPADSPLPFFVSLALLDSRGSGWTNGQQWPCGSSQTFSRVLLFLIYLFSLIFFFFFLSSVFISFLSPRHCKVFIIIIIIIIILERLTY
jgi:hypothetical protein